MFTSTVDEKSKMSVAILDFPGIHTCKSYEFEPLAQELTSAVINLNIKNGSSNTLVLENAIVFKDMVVFIFSSIDNSIIDTFFKRIDFGTEEYTLHVVQDIDIGALLNPLGEIFHKRSFM